MATAAVQLPQSTPTYSPQILEQSTSKTSAKPQDVHTTLNYYKPNEDGSPPHPTYVDRPETYNRPFETHPSVVHDVTGRENEYTLDGNGFQFHTHTSVEKDFLDEEQIKAWREVRSSLAQCHFCVAECSSSDHRRGPRKRIVHLPPALGARSVCKPHSSNIGIHLGSVQPARLRRPFRCPPVRYNARSERTHQAGDSRIRRTVCPGREERS